MFGSLRPLSVVIVTLLLFSFFIFESSSANIQLNEDRINIGKKFQLLIAKHMKYDDVHVESNYDCLICEGLAALLGPLLKANFTDDKVSSLPLDCLSITNHP